MIKYLTLAGALLASTALTVPANATLNMTIKEDATTIFTGNDAGTGVVTGVVTNALFTLVEATGSGTPAIPSPDIGLITLDITSGTGFSGTHTIDINLVQSALAAFGGGPVIGDFTVNTNIGGPGPITEDFLVDGVVTQTFTFPSTGSQNVTTIAAAHAAGWSDGEHILATFTGPNQELEATIEVKAVPEPASLTIFGAALLGMGVVGRLRRRKNGKTDLSGTSAA